MPMMSAGAPRQLWLAANDEAAGGTLPRLKARELEIEFQHGSPWPGVICVGLKT